MRIHKYILTTLYIVIFSACSSFPKVVQSTETLQPTTEPTFTVPLVKPINEITKTPIFLPTPQNGTPVANWEDIPVIPGAFKGWAVTDNQWYICQINSPVDEVEKYYIKELESKGWTIHRRKADVNTFYGPHGTLLEFIKDPDKTIIQIIIVVYTEDNSTLITLAKYQLGE